MRERMARFSKYMEIKGLNDNQVTSMCNLSQGLIGKARTGRSDLGRMATEKILTTFQDLSRPWLIAGVGEMLISSSKTTDAVVEYDSPPKAQPSSSPPSLGSLVDELKSMITECKSVLADCKESANQATSLLNTASQMMNTAIKVNSDVQSSHIKVMELCNHITRIQEKHIAEAHRLLDEHYDKYTNYVDALSEKVLTVRNEIFNKIDKQGMENERYSRESTADIVSQCKTLPFDTVTAKIKDMLIEHKKSVEAV